MNLLIVAAISAIIGAWLGFVIADIAKQIYRKRTGRAFTLDRSDIAISNATPIGSLASQQQARIAKAFHAARNAETNGAVLLNALVHKEIRRAQLEVVK